MSAPLDILGTRYDSRESIGAVYPGVQIETDTVVTGPNDLVEVVGNFPARTAQGEAVEIVGINWGAIAEGAQKTGETVQAVSSTAMTIKKAVDPNTQPDKTTEDIHSVTRSPVLHATLGAVAAVVPWGTAVAGVAEVGLFLVDIGATLFGGHPPKPLPERKIKKVGKSYGWNMFVATYGAKKEDRQKAKKWLVQHYTQYASASTAQAKNFVAALHNGLTEKEAEQIATLAGTSAGQNNKAIQVVAINRFLELEKAHLAATRAAKKAPPDLSKVQATLKEGNANLIHKAREAKKRVGPGIKGTFVSASGEKKTGQWVRMSGGDFGAVVTPSGRAVVGIWREVRRHE